MGILTNYLAIQEEPPEQEEFEKFFTVFHGSSPEDVSHARQFWSSLSLLPPLESRLVSADVRQRLPVSRPQRSSTAAVPGPEPFAPEPRSVRQRQEERQRYLAMAVNRKEVMALLRSERKQKIQKKLPSVAFKPKVEVDRDQMLKPEDASEYEMDKELVKELQ